jgi:ATP/maltotriose-dependent transcriptional regulator MalT
MMMAEVLLLRNDAPGAEEWLTRAIDVENANDDRYFSAEVHRISAICLARRGETELARAALQKAVDVARSQGARFFELRAALTIVQHDPTQGGVALRSVIADFPEPELWPEVESARQILGYRSCSVGAASLPGASFNRVRNARSALPPYR